MKNIQPIYLLSITFLWTILISSTTLKVEGFTLTMMGSRRGKGNLKRSLDPSTAGDASRMKNPTGSTKSLNGGRGQEITGVTLPAEGSIKGWQFGNDQTIACAQINNNYYGIQGSCPRCAFDLYKGTIITDDVAFGKDVPRIACPTCATTFSLRTGKHGPPLKRTGLAGFVGSLAKQATISDASKDAKVFVITRDAETEQVFCRDV
mmetsp:Transcript_34248/g.51687  ORF Transcript_34248/g.51687 Transcript_34248/m.51687 type:complete len:206 (-) Transcript_34248:303-920(-)